MIKKFRFNIKDGLQLINIEEVNEYLINKIRFFSSNINFYNKDNLLNLLQEIKEMCNYDYRTASIDTSEINNVQGFDIKRYRKEMIYYYNFVIILGTIFYYAFNTKENIIVDLKESSNGPISTRNMFAEAYADIINAKVHNGTSAYGATLILSSLIEEELKAKTKTSYIHKYLLILDSKLISKEITLSEKENTLFTYLKNIYILNKTCDFTVDGYYATTYGCYNLFSKYSLITESDKSFWLNKLTMNPFLSSVYFSNIADRRFLSALEIIFNSDKMNLRNNLAHCNYGHVNYYNISCTTLLLGILIIISENYYLS